MAAATTTWLLTGQVCPGTTVSTHCTPITSTFFPSRETCIAGAAQLKFSLSIPPDTVFDLRCIDTDQQLRLQFDPLPPSPPPKP